MCWLLLLIFFFQAEDGIRDLVRSRGLGDVYKRQSFAGGTGALLTGDFLRDGAADLLVARPESSDVLLSLIHI